MTPHTVRSNICAPYGVQIQLQDERRRMGVIAGRTPWIQCLLCEWVQHTNTCFNEILVVTCDNRQFINQRRCGNLLIQSIFWMRSPEPSPKLCDVLVDIEYVI